MHRSVATPLLVLPIVLAGIAITTLSSAAASTSPADDLQLRATISDFTASPNRAPDAPQQPGDQAFFIAQLTQNGKQVGLSPHHCTAITADYSLCEAVANLPGGQVSFQTALGGTNQAPRVAVAITGGTGKYRDAHGQLTITQPVQLT